MKGPKCHGCDNFDDYTHQNGQLNIAIDNSSRKLFFSIRATKSTEV